MLSAATAALLSGHAVADTSITNKVTSPIDTSTDGNITIQSDGSVIITTNPPTAAAVTINSDNNIVNNGGIITYKGVSDAVGIKLTTGYTGQYEGTGKIDLTGTGLGKSAFLISGITGDPNSG